MELYHHSPYAFVVWCLVSAANSQSGLRNYEAKRRQEMKGGTEQNNETKAVSVPTHVSSPKLVDRFIRNLVFGGVHYTLRTHLHLGPFEEIQPNRLGTQIEIYKIFMARRREPTCNSVHKFH